MFTSQPWTDYAVVVCTLTIVYYLLIQQTANIEQVNLSISIPVSVKKPAPKF